MEKSIGQPGKLERFSFSNRLKDTHSNSNEKVSALKLYPLAQIIRTLPSSPFLQIVVKDSTLKSSLLTTDQLIVGKVVGNLGNR